MQTLPTLFRGTSVGGGAGADDIIVVQIPGGSLAEGDIVEITAAIDITNANALTDATPTPTFALTATGSNTVDLIGDAASATVIKATTSNIVIRASLMKVGNDLVVQALRDLSKVSDTNTWTAFVVAPNKITPTDLASETLITIAIDLSGETNDLTAVVSAVRAIIL